MHMTFRTNNNQSMLMVHSTTNLKREHEKQTPNSNLVFFVLEMFSFTV